MRNDEAVVKLNKPAQDCGTISLSALKVNDRNPRCIKESAFRKLCESIKRDPRFMELRPIIVDEHNVILGGNQRYRACLDLGIFVRLFGSIRLV